MQTDFNVKVLISQNGQVCLYTVNLFCYIHQTTWVSAAPAALFPSQPAKLVLWVCILYRMPIYTP